MHLPATIDARLIGTVRKDLEAARQDTLRNIASTEAGREILAELIKSDTFAPVAKPIVLARMYRGPDGLYLGHAKGVDGKIAGNARWLKVSTVGSRLLTSAAMITGHLMLIEISNKLDRVQKDIDAIRDALYDDRMGSLRAAIAGVNDALEASTPENRKALVMARIPLLDQAIYQTIAALKREIAEIRQKKWNVFDREPEIRSKLTKAEKTFRACLEGISHLSQAYFAIDERRIGCNAAVRRITELQEAGISDAEFKARLLKPKDLKDRPEDLWGDFRRGTPEMIELFHFESRRRDEDTAEIDVELLPAEIETALRDATATPPRSGGGF